MDVHTREGGFLSRQVRFANAKESCFMEFCLRVSIDLMILIEMVHYSQLHTRHVKRWRISDLAAMKSRKRRISC